MRSVDREEVPGLGKPLPRPEPAKPTPKEVEIRPGVIRDSEGRLRTQIPENEQARVIPDPWAPYCGTVETWGRVIERLHGKS